ncbi:hypothetical protein [Neptuniibacter sp. QD37_11]|uniref:hypothetical protein n=1 Tax=Neptuniibacter sp. QD37_11 TaxID=3398209 RepID=UPI0039F5CE11
MPYVYGPNGEHRGAVSSVSPQHQAMARGLAPIIANLIFIAIYGVLAYWLWGFLSDWSSLGQPYRYIAGFYYHIAVVPLSYFANVWDYGSGLTQYSNLNLIIGSALVVLYGVGLLMVLGMINQFSKSLKLQKFIPLILIGPLFVAAFWYAGSSVLSFLLST